jgi:hypothetical protein
MVSIGMAILVAVTYAQTAPTDPALPEVAASSLHQREVADGANAERCHERLEALDGTVVRSGPAAALDGCSVVN